MRNACCFPTAAPGGPCSTETIARVAAKAEATLVARAALAGVVVTRIEADNGAPQWVASKWALCRAFDSLEQLSSWVDRVTGKAA